MQVSTAQLSGYLLVGRGHGVCFGALLAANTSRRYVACGRFCQLVYLRLQQYGQQSTSMAAKSPRLLCRNLCDGELPVCSATQSACCKRGRMQMRCETADLRMHSRTLTRWQLVLV